jgi:hypothetical protein
MLHTHYNYMYLWFKPAMVVNCENLGVSNDTKGFVMWHLLRLHMRKI